VLLTDTIMVDAAAKTRLARAVLQFALELTVGHRHTLLTSPTTESNR